MVNKFTKVINFIHMLQSKSLEYLQLMQMRTTPKFNSFFSDFHFHSHH